VGFAVVLLTPDDFRGRAGHREKALPGARQNVVLELGYFMGKLGRGKVCCLYVNGVELLSDYQGVLWLPYDDSGAWRDQLAKEQDSTGSGARPRVPCPVATFRADTSHSECTSCHLRSNASGGSTIDGSARKLLSEPPG